MFEKKNYGFFSLIIQTSSKSRNPTIDHNKQQLFKNGFEYCNNLSLKYDF